MEKEYMLKTGDFYITNFCLDCGNMEYDFLESLIFSTNKDRALKLPYSKAKYLKRILYINAGIDCTIEGV